MYTRNRRELDEIFFFCRKTVEEPFWGYEVLYSGWLTSSVRSDATVLSGSTPCGGMFAFIFGSFAVEKIDSVWRSGKAKEKMIGGISGRMLCRRTGPAETVL